MTDHLEPTPTTGETGLTETKPQYEPPEIVDLSRMAQAQGGNVGVPACGNGSAVQGACVNGPAPSGDCADGSSPRVFVPCNVGNGVAGN